MIAVSDDFQNSVALTEPDLSHVWSFFGRFLSKQRYIDVDEEEQNLAPKFLFTSADLEVTEGSQVGRVATLGAWLNFD